MAERRAIVTLSIGDRPWFQWTRATFEHYAQRCGADLIIETNEPSLSEFPLEPLPDSPGRRNKRVYGCKAYFAWKHLAAGYDRVLVLDDSCCVRVTAPDLFEMVPPGHLGGKVTSSDHAASSFQTIAEFLSRTGRPEIEFNFKHYLNSGVLLYDRAITSAISPERVADCAPLLFDPMPHQTLTYYLIKAARVPIHGFPNSCNMMPGYWLPIEERKRLDSVLHLIDDAGHIYHLTGAYRKRRVILPELAQLFLSEWGSPSAKPGQRHLAS